MVDWQIQPLSRTCAATGEPLQEGERVACYLFRDDEGQLRRADIHAGAADTYLPTGRVLGRWGRTLKPRSEEDKEARQQALASAEELFLSLFETVGEAEDATADALKQVLALLLERKRIL
jgi:hypothetical protein